MNLFDAATAQEIEDRVASLTPESKREWGKMNAAQTVAHCSLAIEMALGEKNPPRVFVGRILGPVVKKLALGNDEPMRKNFPDCAEPDRGRRPRSGGGEGSFDWID